MVEIMAEMLNDGYSIEDFFAVVHQSEQTKGRIDNAQENA